MRKLCVKIKLSEIKSISEKAVRAKDYNGNSDVLPKSQIYYIGGNTYWVADFIARQKPFPYKYKSKAWVDFTTGREIPQVIVENIVPVKIEPIKRDLSEFER